ncbi:MAG: hypothetical protein WA725_03255, partial [Pseudolabrys sp.]
LYAQATEWLDSHGVSITNLVADSYNPGWIIGKCRCVRAISDPFLTVADFGIICCGSGLTAVARLTQGISPKYCT